MKFRCRHYTKEVGHDRACKPLSLMKIALSLLLLISFGNIYGQERFVEVNGHRFHVYSKGLEKRKPNEPVLIFENGMGKDRRNAV